MARKPHLKGPKHRHTKQHPRSFLPHSEGGGPSGRLAGPTPPLCACTHGQDGAVPLHEIRQLVQQPAAAQGIQPAPWRASLEGGLCSLHGLVYVELHGGNNRESVSPFAEGSAVRELQSLRPLQRKEGRQAAQSKS